MNAPLTEGSGASHQDVELLRFATAGSVDDGKSTLIGRLLFDAKALFDDQLAQLDESFDLASLTDGLRAEREQGITIDVAYRYFATPRRRFVVADCPGHLEYTRNAFTGMSTADAALLLVDVRHGVVAQTRRHSFIAGLIGLRRVIFCVNKMDMVAYSESAFVEVRDALVDLAHRLGVPEVSVVPVSALEGDNVIERSTHMPWYDGPALLELLETVPPREVRREEPGRERPARLAVQCVLRDGEGGRAYAGLVSGGSLRVGDEVVVLPSGRATRLSGIETFDGPLEEAEDGQSVSLRLDDEIDVGRGDVIAPATAAPTVTQELRATVCWMAERPLRERDRVELKVGTSRVAAIVRRVVARFDFEEHRYVEGSEPLTLNDVAQVELRLASPQPLDRHADHAEMGRLLIVDPQTKDTLGAGLVDEVAATG